MASSLKVATIFLLCLIVAQPFAAQAGITCGQVTGALGPCLAYLQGGKSVTPACCGGVKSLNAAAKTTPDRQQACHCLKTAASSIKGIDLGAAAALPGACNVNIPYAISPNTDCAKVK